MSSIIRRDNYELIVFKNKLKLMKIGRNDFVHLSWSLSVDLTSFTMYIYIYTGLEISGFALPNENHFWGYCKSL